MVFLWLLPNEEVELDRNADGIVVLTGGTSRVTDALELLAAGRGKRLLITGVNPGTTTTDIARQVAGYAASGMLRRPRLFRDQHARQCRGDTPLGHRSWLPLAHHRHLRLPHAAGARRDRASASGSRSVPLSRSFPTACASSRGGQTAHHATGTVGIFQIPIRQSAHAFNSVAAEAGATIVFPTRGPTAHRLLGGGVRHLNHGVLSCSSRPLEPLQRAVLCEHQRSHARRAADPCNAAFVRARRLALLCAEHVWLLRVVCRIEVEWRGLKKFRKERESSPPSISPCGRPLRCSRSLRTRPSSSNAS